MTDLAAILVIGALASVVISRMISLPLAYVIGLAPLFGAVLYFTFAFFYGCAQGARRVVRVIVPRKQR
ncbi:MAG: hypothetical protein HYS06_13090 [Methylocystis sp.]|nr:hypothetical protein [Methylocystis sp.]